jgi:hypothetical protein
MSERAVLYQDASGNEVTALDLVSSVTVSVGDKMSIKDERGNIQTIAPMISMTATIPPEQQSGEMAMEVARQLYAQINSMIQGITRQKMGLPINGNGHHQEPENAIETAPEPPQGDSEPPEEPETHEYRDQGMVPIVPGEALQYPPKAKDRRPGQYWAEQAIKYKWEEFISSAGNKKERIIVTSNPGQYPNTTSIVPWGNRDKWPNEDIREVLGMVKDGSEHQFPRDVWLQFQVSNEKMDNGNYRVCVIAWHSSEEKARLAPAA